MQFPDGFEWGATLSAYQVEGVQAPSDWWRWEQRPGRIRDGASAWPGAAHADRYRDDLALARKLGLSGLLLVLEWSRIEPEPGGFDPVALDHYAAELDAANQAGLAPLLAFQHVTLPAWFAKKGGWTATDAPETFVRYVETTAKRLGALCTRCIPVYEPLVAVERGYGYGDWPPGTPSWIKIQRACRLLADAHRLVANRVRDAVPGAAIGLSAHVPACQPDSPHSPWDLRVARARMRRAMNWVEALTDTADFIAVGCPGAERIRIDPWRASQHWARRIPWESGGAQCVRPDPAALGRVLDWAATLGKPIYVAGMGTAEAGDEARCRFVLDHIAVAGQAMERGAPIKGYYARSLLDGFEWDAGYSTRYGLVHVDRRNMARTPNRSAYLFKEISEAGGLTEGLIARYAPGWTPPQVALP